MNPAFWELLESAEGRHDAEYPKGFWLFKA
jgi:hypothetical protein